MDSGRAVNSGARTCVCTLMAVCSRLQGGFAEIPVIFSLTFGSAFGDGTLQSEIRGEWGNSDARGDRPGNLGGWLVSVLFVL